MVVPHFPPRLRIMSHLDRWGNMPRNFPSKVSDHSWFVAVYAVMVADLIEWEGDRSSLLMGALFHDVGETATGDIVSPAKDRMVDRAAMQGYVEDRMQATMPSVLSLIARSTDDHRSAERRAIIRCADRLDDMFYTCMEMAFCNPAMAARLVGLGSELQQRWFSLPAGKEKLARLWADMVAPSIFAHQNGENYDF